LGAKLIKRYQEISRVQVTIDHSWSKSWAHQARQKARTQAHMCRMCHMGASEAQNCALRAASFWISTVPRVGLIWFNMA
jgi:hypothetical protein